MRERPDDIALLADRFLAVYAGRNNKNIGRLGKKEIERLKAYNWPGNVRELKNIIERSVILSSQGQLDLSFSLGQDPSTANPFADHPTMDELQQRYILYILEKTGGKIGGPGGAAEKLGLQRATPLIPE